MQWWEINDLLIHILGLHEDADDDEIEQALCDKWEISSETAFELINVLLPLCDVGQSPITGEYFKGFSKWVNKETGTKTWLLKEYV